MATRSSPLAAPAITGSPDYFSNVMHLSSVGAYGLSESEYGTFDQGGNLWESTEATTGLNRIIRGGSWDGVYFEMKAFRRTSEAENVG